MTILRKSNVTFGQWRDFRLAIGTLIRDGKYQELVDIHAVTVTEPDGFVRALHRMHGGMYGPVGFRRFLAWHRAYLIAFERELRIIDPTLSIPYWDWDNDEGQLVGIRDILGLSSGRNLGPLPGESPDADRRVWFSFQAQTLGYEQYLGDFFPFTRELEGNMHNNGHGWVGGDMANIRISPNDPIFWMHHAQIDRIWSVWQGNNPGENASLEEEEQDLDPWENEFSIDSISDISNLGADSYEYEVPKIVTP